MIPKDLGSSYFDCIWDLACGMDVSNHIFYQGGLAFTYGMAAATWGACHSGLARRQRGGCVHSIHISASWGLVPLILGHTRCVKLVQVPPSAVPAVCGRWGPRQLEAVEHHAIRCSSLPPMWCLRPKGV